MMSSREIITIQCGHYSNFVGTHWWNLQESGFCYDQAAASSQPKEICNDVMFREGHTLQGEVTYTPRLVALDLSGSLRTLKVEGQLYENSKEVPGHSTWDGNVETHEKEKPQKNEFLHDLQQLDSGKMNPEDMESKAYSLQSAIEVWSDFLRIHLHPKSLITVPGVFHDNSSVFQRFPAGHLIWDREFQETVEDRLHFFVEECDHLQGFHLLVDQDDGFGGVASRLAQELADEFGSKGLLAIPLSLNTQPLDKGGSFGPALLNHALCLDELCTHSSAVCPLSLLVNPWRSHAHPPLRPLPPLDYDSELPYHTSAVLAAALETASLVYRMEQPPLTISSLADCLTTMGRKLCGLSSCLPLSLPADSTLLSELDHTPLHLQLHPLTPFCDSSHHCWAQTLALRGIPKTYPLCDKQDPRYSYCQYHPSLAVSSHLSQHFPTSTTTTHLSVLRTPLTLGNPFPTILPHHDQQHRKVPSCAAFRSQAGLQTMLHSLSSELKHMNVRKYPDFTSTCLDMDSYAELKERLLTMETAYRTKPDLDEPSDSD